MNYQISETIWLVVLLPFRHLIISVGTRLDGFISQTVVCNRNSKSAKSNIRSKSDEAIQLDMDYSVWCHSECFSLEMQKNNTLLYRPHLLPLFFSCSKRTWWFYHVYLVEQTTEIKGIWKWWVLRSNTTTSSFITTRVCNLQTAFRSAPVLRAVTATTDSDRHHEVHRSARRNCHDSLLNLISRI